jgi:hypothetical protein
MTHVRGMVPLGHGRFVRVDRIYAVLPVEGPERGPHRRTDVYVEGVSRPIPTGHSERTVAADMQRALAEGTGAEPRRRLFRRGPAHRATS